MNREVGIRERILDAAVRIADKGGIKELTQPKVAKAAGVSQSHLTYYFPHKIDLLAAVLAASHDHVSLTARGDEPPPDVEQALKTLDVLMFSPRRMRFFLGAVTEAEEGTALQALLFDHAGALTRNIAAAFGRENDDPMVQTFVDRLRGMGVRLLLERKGKRQQKIDLAAIARECGLM